MTASSQRMLPAARSQGSGEFFLDPTRFDATLRPIIVKDSWMVVGRPPGSRGNRWIDSDRRRNSKPRRGPVGPMRIGEAAAQTQQDARVVVFPGYAEVYQLVCDGVDDGIGARKKGDAAYSVRHEIWENSKQIRHSYLLIQFAH